MDRKMIKPIVVSALSALAFGAVGTAGTFALFTDKAETQINVTAGKVDVRMTSDNLKFFELDHHAANEAITTTNASGAYVNSIGGTAKLEGNALTLQKWAPGDKVTFDITVRNFSNVAIRTMLDVQHSHVGTDLWDALEVSYHAVDGSDNNIDHKFLDWQRAEPASDVVNGEIYSKISVTVEFPDHDNGELRFGDDNLDNAYQNADCTIVFTQLAVQANASVTSLLERVNAVLEGSSSTIATLYDAIAEIDAANESVWDAAFVKSNQFVWNSANDRFVYFDDVPAGQEYKYFKVYSAMPTTAEGYSIYLHGASNVGPISLDGIGFDAGNSSGITSVSYVDTVDALGRTNYIRTNSAVTAVTIDAEHDTVHHYGQAGSLNIIAVAGSSYHEHGQVAFAEISKGRIALEKEAEVAQIHVSSIKDNNGDTTNVFDEIIIAKDPDVELPKLSRDDVNIAAAGTLVVALQEGTGNVQQNELDYVWLTKQGIYEQIKVSNSDESAGTVWADDESNSATTQDAAQQIANNIGRDAQGKIDAQVTVGTATFDVDLDDDRNIILVDDKTAAEPATVYTVTSDNEGNTVIKDALDQDADAEVATAVSTAVAAEVKKTGLDEDTKEEAKTEAVDVAVSNEMANNYVARIGSVGYEDLKVAIAEAEYGDTVHLLQDVLLTSAIGDVDCLHLNGNGNRVAFANGKQPFGSISNSFFEDIEFEWYMGKDYILTDYFGNNHFKNVSLFGEGTMNGLCGAVAYYVYGENLLEGVKIFCDLQGDGAASNYNAAFFGYIQGNSTVTIRDSSFEGSLKCGSAAMFVGNPCYAGNVTLNIQNVKNNGIIHSTCSNENIYFQFNQFSAVVYDGTLTGYNINVDGNSVDASKVTTIFLNSLVGTGSFLFGPDDATLAINKGEDLSLTVTKASMEGAHHYMITIGCYVNVPTGTNRNYVHEIIVPEGEGNTFVAQTKYYGFVDYAWVENNPSAVEGTLNGETIYTLGNNTYYLVSEERHSTKGQPNAVEICSVSAFDANGKLLCSASLVNN